ncbi:ABC transporter ATP-binding protein [Plantactinospora sp. CA-294935]|uniref:ABC transporter ATP-binding protein n=1 Tax=Plantactinospora sp. CA-294935 TaxID=3240012 RepID=UPI003D8D0077
MRETAIEVIGLRVRYPGAATDAVAGIDFTVGTGEVFGFLGPNGAGKSSTQRVLTGQLAAYHGRAVVLGRPVREWRTDLYQRIGVGFELPAHYPRLTARENLAAFAGLHRLPTAAVDEALTAVGLTEVAGRRASELSKGMQMRLNLARAILHQPDLLFLDEPTSGLDPTHAAGVRSIISAQAAAGRTVFLTTHDMATADEMCDRVAFIHHGRLAAIDTPRALRMAHGTATVAVEYVTDGTLHSQEYAGTADPALRQILATGTVRTIHTREASLADVFVAVTGGTL